MTQSSDELDKYRWLGIIVNKNKNFMKNVEVAPILDSCRNDERPYLIVNVSGIEIKVLLDSGATNTLLGNNGLMV